MTEEWIFDKNLSPTRVKEILANAEDAHFIEIATLLLARNNEAKKVFNYIPKEIFIRHWPKIKKRMRQNQWNSKRIIFWEAIYEKLLKTFKEKGFTLRQTNINKPLDDLCAIIGHQIKKARQHNNQTQKDLAASIKISQQMISHIENGYENISLLTLKKIAQSLGKEVVIKIK